MTVVCVKSVLNQCNPWDQQNRKQTTTYNEKDPSNHNGTSHASEQLHIHM